MITETDQNHLTRIRRQYHATCVVCGPGNDRGLKLDFRISDDGAVVGDFYCDKTLEGYMNLLHGGVISAILDGAMTNCLFAAGHVAVTADFSVRFRHSVIAGQWATVRAWFSRITPPVYVLKAEIIQKDQLKTTAVGKFMEPSRSLEKSEHSIGKFFPI